jgi:hypothetical protein
MKLFDFNYQFDFGHEFYIRVLFNKHWVFFLGSVSWSEYSGLPFLQIQSGSGSLLSIILNVYKFGISVAIASVMV